MYLFYCCELKSCILFYCCDHVLTWYTNEGKKKKKTRRKSPVQQLVLSSGRGRERVPKLPERSDDPFALPLKAKVERNSRWFPMKANRSERAQKLGDC